VRLARGLQARGLTPRRSSICFRAGASSCDVAHLRCDGGTPCLELQDLHTSRIHGKFMATLKLCIPNECTTRCSKSNKLPRDSLCKVASSAAVKLMLAQRMSACS